MIPSLDDLRSLACEIKEAVRPYLGRRSITGEICASGDLMRKVDVVADDVIRRTVEERNWTLGIVTEELGSAGDGPPYLLIDPVDGSVNADLGIPIASVSIALTEDHRLSSVREGVVLSLFQDEEYFAMRGEGAFLNGERIHVEEPRDDVAVIYAPCRGGVHDLKKVLGIRHLSTRDYGCISMGLAYLSRGLMHAVMDMGYVRPFDVAAGFLLVKEAGGLVVADRDPDVRDVKGCFSFISASSPKFCNLLMDRLSKRFKPIF